jgi:hypothetical protein
MKFGQIELNQFEACKLPQRAASAFSVLEGLTGATYKPLVYCGTQIVKGVNHYFIAEMTIAYSTPQRHIVSLCINEFEGDYKLIKESVEIIL